MRVTLLCGWACSLVMTQTLGAELVVVKGPHLEASLVACSGSGMEFLSGENKTTRQSVGWHELVRWSHSQRLSTQPQVLLADGSLLVVAEEWTKRGATLRLQSESLGVSTKLLGEIEIPRNQLAAIVLSPHREMRAWQRQMDQIRDSAEEFDQVHLRNGDLLTGIVTAFDGERLEIETDTGSMKVEASRVQAMAFNPALLRTVEKGVPYIATGLADGSLIYAKEIRADESQLELTTCGDVRLSAGSVNHIASLQTIRGSGFDYLSDLQPTDTRHIPYLNLPWQLAIDRNVRGGPLFSGGQRLLKGLGMHAASRVVYALDHTRGRFEAEIALDDSTGTRGSVVFRVFLAKGEQWQEAFTSQVVRGGDPPRPVSIDLAGAQAITLIVDYADRGDEMDHANWLNARLVHLSE